MGDAEHQRTAGKPRSTQILRPQVPLQAYYLEVTYMRCTGSPYLTREGQVPCWRHRRRD
jgi:hypothetical protein